MSKHTTGPWSVNYTKINGAITHWHITGEKHGSAYPICAHTIEDEPSGAEQIANARLIAAAPDMLDALRKAHRMLTRDYIDDAKMAVIDIVDTAIAKATGETE